MTNDKILIHLAVLFGFSVSVMLAVISKSAHFLTGILITLTILTFIFANQNFKKELRFLKKILVRNHLKVLLKLIRNNFGVFIIVSFYLGLAMTTLTWGAPNPTHPFPHHMDEWHQLQAMRALFTQGSNNVEGAAYGTILNYILSGLYVAVFSLFGVIDPRAIQSSVDNLSEQMRIFGILRLGVAMYGAGALLLFSYISSHYFGLSKYLSAFLLLTTPVFLLLGNYFKYDITLIFFILLSFLFTLRYTEKPNTERFILMCIACAVAFCIKMSAVALLPIPFAALLLFEKGIRQVVIKVFLGIGVISSVVLTVGMPDFFFKLNEYQALLSSNTEISLGFNDVFTISQSFPYYAVFHMFPILYGYGLFIVYLVSIPATILLCIKKPEFRKLILLLLALQLLFFITLLQLKWQMGSNRPLVLVPFVIISVLLYLKYFLMSRFLALSIVVFLVVLQIIQATSFLAIKYNTPIQEGFGKLMREEIEYGKTIGIENIPLYQFLPDLIIKEFYLVQYNVENNNFYKYKIINQNDVEYPEFIVISNASIAQDYYRSSSKQNIINKLKKNGYQESFKLKTDLKTFSLFGNSFDYYFAGLLAMPYDITAYEKK